MVSDSRIRSADWVETEFSAVVSAYCYSIFENTYFSSPVYGNGKFVIVNVI